MNLKNISKVTIKTCMKRKEKLLFVLRINSDITHHDLAPNTLFSQMRVGRNALSLSLTTFVLLRFPYNIQRRQNGGSC